MARLLMYLLLVMMLVQLTACDQTGNSHLNKRNGGRRRRFWPGDPFTDWDAIQDAIDELNALAELAVQTTSGPPTTPGPPMTTAPPTSRAPQTTTTTEATTPTMGTTTPEIGTTGFFGQPPINQWK